jgi:hypothetical protein
MFWLLLWLGGARDVDTLVESVQEGKVAFVHITYCTVFSSSALQAMYRTVSDRQAFEFGFGNPINFLDALTADESIQIIVSSAIKQVHEDEAVLSPES